MTRPLYPFTAIVGQDLMKKALILNTISPAIGGVLIQGEKGSAKSTAVRALQGLLPEIAVVESCPFHCDPEDREHLCSDCGRKARRRALAAMRRRVPFVNLPIGTTEDRLLGTLDIEHAIQKGRRKFQPGLLAQAHRGILYIDEVNLLDDHLVDAMLDAAAMGMNVVERDGMSVEHAASFILVGTMNPEEGELRPQLLDRFALSVAAERIEDPQMRTEIVARRIAFEKDPVGFGKQWEDAQTQERERIAHAQQLLPRVRMSADLQKKISLLCVDAAVDGMRADIVIHKTSASLAAYHARCEIADSDVEEAAQLALFHRRRQRASAPPKSSVPQPREQAAPDRESLGDQAAPDQTPAPSEPFRVRAWDSQPPRVEKVSRAGQGRREPVVDASTHGRVVRWRAPKDKIKDIHWPATMRQAALQEGMTEGNLALRIRPRDARENVREKRLAHLVVFVVDASGSMGAKRRMEQTKGAVLSLLLDSYQKRDRVAMIAFRGRGAAVLLPPTRGLERARRCLRELPTGGRTPLTAGLAKALEVLRPLSLGKDASCLPMVVLITDGKANVFDSSGTPPAQLAGLSAEFRRKKIRLLVIDTEDGFVRLGKAREIGLALGAKTVSLGSLRAEDLAQTVRQFAS